MSLNMNNHYKVKNLKGTSDNFVPSEYNSWIDYYKSNTGSKREMCSKFGCGNKGDLVGAHVKIIDKRCNDDWYIVPLCRTCNHNSNINDF